MRAGKNERLSAASPASSPGRAALTGATNRVPDRSPDKALRAAIRGGAESVSRMKISTRRGPAKPPAPAARRPSRSGCCGYSG
ncbi:TPA: hypothetical protein MIM75_14290 [Klebsiella variicola]|nr:hypothetical protein DMS91_22650 [Klebsiella variicola]HBX9965689.1 hypothetical protein [Klebsiella variicola]HBX9971062.1 hypothetical protein [Klebsiella variicola]